MREREESRMNSTFSDWKDGEVFSWDEEVCGEDRSAGDRGQWAVDISGGQIWINDVSNVLLILDSSVILVCLYKLKWMKFHEILSACHILSPSGSFRELPSHMLLHGQNGEGLGTLAIDCGLAHEIRRCKNSIQWEQPSLGTPTRSCCLRVEVWCKGEGRERWLRSSRGKEAKEEGEAYSWRGDQREMQNCLLLRQRCISRWPGLALSCKPGGNLHWFPFGLSKGNPIAI